MQATHKGVYFQSWDWQIRPSRNKYTRIEMIQALHESVECALARLALSYVLGFSALSSDGFQYSVHSMIALNIADIPEQEGRLSVKKRQYQNHALVYMSSVKESIGQWKVVKKVKITLHISGAVPCEFSGGQKISKISLMLIKPAFASFPLISKHKFVSIYAVCFFQPILVFLEVFQIYLKCSSFLESRM